MHALLHHPAAVAGLAPFLVALVSAELFMRLRLSGLALIAGFAVTVYLLADFNIEPLTLNHKIIWLGLGSALLGLLLGVLDWSWLSVLMIPIATAVTVWLIWPMVQTHTLQYALAWSAGCALFLSILAWGMDELNNEPLRSANAATALGLGTGIAVFDGASTLYGQFSFALGAAAAALLLIQMVSKQAIATGRSFTLPAALVCGVIASISVVNGHLIWYCLPLFAAIPVAAWVMPLPKLGTLWQGMLLCVATFSLAAGAVYFSGFRITH